MILNVLGSLFIEHLLKKPCDYWQVLPLVVGGQEDGVLVVLRHVCSQFLDTLEYGRYAMSQWPQALDIKMSDTSWNSFCNYIGIVLTMGVLKVRGKGRSWRMAPLRQQDISKQMKRVPSMQ